MVKIKDFTLASKNLRGGGHVLPVPYTPPAHVNVYILYLKLGEGPRGANARLTSPWLRH